MSAASRAEMERINIKRLAGEGSAEHRKYLPGSTNRFRYGFFTGKVKDLPWDGDRYTGPVVNGRPHGDGTLRDSYGYIKGNFTYGVKKGRFLIKKGGKKSYYEY